MTYICRSCCIPEIPIELLSTGFLQVKKFAIAWEEGEKTRLDDFYAITWYILRGF